MFFFYDLGLEKGNAYFQMIFYL